MLCRASSVHPQDRATRPPFCAPPHTPCPSTRQDGITPLPPHPRSFRHAAQTHPDSVAFVSDCAGDDHRVLPSVFDPMELTLRPGAVHQPAGRLYRLLFASWALVWLVSALTLYLAQQRRNQRFCPPAIVDMATPDDPTPACVRLAGWALNLRKPALRRSLSTPRQSGGEHKADSNETARPLAMLQCWFLRIALESGLSIRFEHAHPPERGSPGSTLRQGPGTYVRK